ncbi:phospholipase D-like domain-containing protein [Acidianus sp. HS-5]|uniref:phospholipase D-like domain-containing protein n=1 Tax=Acidianus sp. HS-5 TaxID=2886040 RepID=UPI001F1F9C34|nr:phospholipase D-like domain-containing protein [Acidianus sp. HS-5]BDC18858.1 excisionase [Acidianus sp. HS-5]
MKPKTTIIILILMLLSPTPLFSMHSYSSSPSWYVKIKTCQVSIILGPVNSTDIISCLYNGKYVYAEVYELTCCQIANAIINAVKKGGEAFVVLSANVYGGIPSDEEQLVSELNSSGVHVKFLSGYQYVHSKAFIINNCTVILGSINPTYYGIHKDHGIDLDIRNFSIARAFACIILDDYYGKPVTVNYPGIVVSPINSECELSNILSQPGHLYIAMEELYPSSGFYPTIEGHERTIVTSTYSEDNCAKSQLGAVEIPDMTAKVIVVGNYVYIGSVNLDYTSIHCNRELGIVICNPTIARELSSLISNWAGGKVEGGNPLALLSNPRFLLLIIIVLAIVALYFKKHH